MSFTFKEAFISYGRRESLNLVARLHQQLKLAGYEIWFDKVNIPDGDDYILRINHGIESAHSFIYVMAPRCLTSPYCLTELEYARLLGKRIIPINQMLIYQTDSRPLSDEHQQKMVRFYQFYDLPNQNIRTVQDVLDRSHAIIGKIDWLEGKEKLSDDDCKAIAEWATPYENDWAKHEQIDYLKQLQLPVFGQPINALLPGVVERVTTVLERQQDYVYQHTQILAEALHWQEHQKTTQHLLVGTERTAAEQWLLTEFTPPEQPPCQPSALVSEFIGEARKNAENLMTDIFICASTTDKPIRNELLGSLSRYAKTVWTHDRDIQKGTDYQQAIKTGIENADNFIFVISPDSVRSEHCQRELAYALQYNKRVIPLLAASMPDSEIPEVLRGLQYIDLTENNPGVDEILAILQLEHEYYEWHKVLLARGLKWAAEKHQSTFLLRGHNLEKAKTWLRVNDKRTQHAPLPLHHELITASAAAATDQLGTEVFVSYSRKDSDFARQLNAQLQLAGKITWFDQESIDTGADFEKALFDGIDSADNVLFILSPDAVKSEYCEREVNYAASLGKRVITLLHRETKPDTIPTALQIIQWLDFSDPTQFETAFLALLRALEQQQAYIHQHTQILAHALYWQQHQKSAQHLLIGEQRTAAEQWLLTEFRPPNQPPCQPTPLMREFICEARKNAENRMTDIFVCYDAQDKEIRDTVVQSLSRYAKTCWMHDSDIQKGTRYEYAIEQGIEAADNLLYFISPNAVKSDYCQRELTHAVKYHKRLIPLLIAPTPTSDLPEALRHLQYIDLTTDPADYDRQIDDLLNPLKHDQEYHQQHKQLLVRSRKWAAENRKSIFLLQGHNLEMAKAWLRLAEKRQQHQPLPLHQEFITASDNATSQVGTELFISYSRKDNDFVRKLNTRLTETGKTVWFDQESQASNVASSGDFETETFNGIDNADNFLFVVSPPSVASRYCVAELNHAASRGKRIIAVWHRNLEPNRMPEALHDVQRLEFSNPAEFEAIFLELVRTLDREKAYLHQHTEILRHALRWQQNQKATQQLLVGEQRTAAQQWLLTEFLPPNQPPCQPTPLMCEFICEARKNAENLMTDVFICYHEQDQDLRDSVVQSLARHAKTSWTPDRDIQKGFDDECAIEQGIEGADNFFFLISPASVASDSCQQQLALALKYHKRIVPLLMTPTPISDRPEALRSLQSVDFTDNTGQTDDDNHINDILNLLKSDQDYHKQHKVLLVRALKWADENQKPSFLLRGHNLENAKMWLRLSEKRQQHRPLQRHQQLITASEAAKGQLGTEVFISYSRKNSDFARRLNTQLQETGKTTWFDQESISTGVDFEKEILKGIDSADNFVLVLSPDAVASEYCEREVNYAAEQSKRFISVLHRDTDPTKMPTALQKIHWLDFQTTPFEKSFLELVQAIELDREHAHQHTVLQQRASDWAENNRSPDFLLNITACANAENWQQTALTENKQPVPTGLQQDFIIDSRKAIEAAEQKERKRRKITFAAVTGGMILAIFLAILAVVQMNTANDQLQVAKARLYHAKARELQQTEPTLALRFAEKARQLDPIDESITQTLRDIFLKIKEYDPVSLAHDSETHFAAFSPDEQQIVTVSYDDLNAAKIWTPKGQLLTTLAHNNYVNSAAYSPDGQRIVTASDDNTAKVWEPSGKLLATLEHQDVVNSAAFSSDGQRIVTASNDKTTKVWDPQGQLLQTLNQAVPIQWAIFSPNGQQIVIIVSNRAKILNLDGQLVANLDHQDEVNSIAFSPNGQQIVTTSYDNTAKVWDNVGQLLISLAHQDTVNFATFSPNGQRIVTASNDNTATVWDNAGNLLATLPHQGAVHSATFSPHEKWLVTTSGKTTTVWSNYFVEDYLDREQLPKLTLTQQLLQEVISFDEIGAQVGQFSPNELFEELKTFYQTQISNATQVENKKRYLQQLELIIPVSLPKMAEMKSQIISLETVVSKNTNPMKPPSESQPATRVRMETVFAIMFLALVCVRVIGQLTAFFHQQRHLSGIVYGLITVIVLGSGLVCYENFYRLAPLFDQEAIKQIGEGLPSFGLILFSVLMLIAATGFLFYARKRFFQQPVRRTVLLGFSLLMLVLPIGYLVRNYDILDILSKMDLDDFARYGILLGSVILVFLPIPLTAYALRPNRQNGWRWPAIVLKALSMGFAYVLLLWVTWLLLVLLDGGLAFNAIPVGLRYLLLLVAVLLVGQVIYAQFRVYRQQHQWFSLASFSVVYGLLLFALIWFWLGEGVWIDRTFTLQFPSKYFTFRRVVPYYEMADGLTLLLSLVALGLAMVNGRQTYQTQRYLLSGVYGLASLLLVIGLAIYIPAYGSMLLFPMLVLGSLLFLSYGIGQWLDNRRGWKVRGVTVILVVVAWLVLSNQADKIPEQQPGPEEVQQPDEELSPFVMLTNKQAKKMAQRFVNQTEIFRDQLTDGGEGPEMIRLPAGTFQMGDIQGGGYSDEQRVHDVSVGQFAIGRYEVTFAEYDKFADATGRDKPNDRGWGRGNRPVINVSWHDATAYMEWLSEQTGHQYRLPTEAEWEYAARAGTETKYWWGNDIGSNRANCGRDYCGDSFQYTAPVGSFEANPYGLYDTVGNLWEWTCSEYQDKYAGKEQRCAKGAGLFVVRSGSWFDSAGWARSANRNGNVPAGRGGNYGVRPARIK